MRDWYTVASVRSVERAGPGAGTLFSRALVPWVGKLAGADPAIERELLRRSLGRYLHTTHVLELKVVNRVAEAIAMGELPLPFDEQARLDAHKIYVDEGYHALMAAELIAQLTDDLGLAPPAFLGRLARIEARAASEADRALIRLLFTVVSETVVSANLLTLARDPELVPEVRSFVAQHARDEAWHATYFTARFADLWGWLDPPEREHYAAMLPELVAAFVEPDALAIAEDLAAVGLPEVPLAELWSTEATRAAARPTLQCFERAGVLVEV